MIRHDMAGNIWETKRAVITKLYKEEEWPLKQVIKVIQTETFRPSETQLRARLKKWHITKPSRKKYRSGKAASTGTQENNNLSSSFGLNQEPDGSLAPTNTTLKGLSTVTSTSPEEIPPPTALLDFFSIPDPHLTSLNTALDDYLRASSLLPTPGDAPSPLSTTSNPAPHHGSSITATMSTPSQHLASDYSSLSKRQGNNGQRSSIEGRELSAIQHTCASLDHDSMGPTIHSVESYNESSVPATQSPGNATPEGGTQRWTSPYGPEPWWLAHISPLEQYQTGLSLCKHAIPRLTQRDRWRLGFDRRKSDNQHALSSLSWSSYSAIPPPLPQAHFPEIVPSRHCLACLDYTRI